MTGKLGFYDDAYRNHDAEVMRAVRVETYGEGLGQTSWVTNQESLEIPQLLHVTAGSHVLELGCGSGMYALKVASLTGCRVTGIDINPHGVRNARALAERSGLESQVRFEECDASAGLPFADGSFDAAFGNDVICHIPGRDRLLAEMFRVLKPGGRLLYSDALVIGGIVTDDELAVRSSIGHYRFCPPGENERLLAAAGFELVFARDTTGSVVEISGRRYQARRKREAELLAIEGETNYQGAQRFLEYVQRLTTERRLLRMLFLARKPE